MFFLICPLLSITAHANSIDKLKILLPSEAQSQIKQIKHSHNTIYSIYSSYQPNLLLQDVPYVLTQNKKEILVTSPDLFPKVGLINIKNIFDDLSYDSYNFSPESCWGYSYEVESNIKYVTDKYIWTQSLNSNNMCGTHPSSSIWESNEIKGLGANITLRQIAKNKIAYKKIQNEFIKQADSFKNDYDKKSFIDSLLKAPINVDDNNFSISDGAYAFGTCYACGMHEIDVPKDKILPLIKDKYKNIFTEKSRDIHTMKIVTINNNQSVDSLIHQYINNASLKQIMVFYHLNEDFFKIYKSKKSKNINWAANMQISMPFIYELPMILDLKEGEDPNDENSTVSLITHIKLLQNPTTQKNISKNIESLKNMLYILITKMDTMEDKKGIYQYNDNKWTELK